MGPPFIYLMDINKVVEVLEAYFPLSLQEGWDNSGLQISPDDNSVKGVLLSLDISIDTIKEAKNRNCNVIVAHHPLLFKPAKKMDNSIYPYNVIFEAIREGIGIYAFHTNLDIATGGLNDYLCKLLGLRDVVSVEAHPPLRVGMLENAMSLEDVVLYTQEKLEIACVKYVKGNDEAVKKVAVCSGSCADMVYKTTEIDYDVFITGDLKYHTAFFAKNSGINIIDATHFHTEKYVKYLLREVLEKEFPKLNVKISEKDIEPWSYNNRR